MRISSYGLMNNLQSGSEAMVRAWDRFWFSPTDPTTLCFMRICAGCVLLYVHIGYSFDLMSYVHPDRAWLDEKAYRPLRSEKPTFLPSSDWTEDPAELQRRRLYMIAIEAKDYKEADCMQWLLSRGWKLAPTPYSPAAAGDPKVIDPVTGLTVGLYEAAKLEAERLHEQLQIKEVGKGQYTWSIFFHLHDERWIWAAHITILCCTLLFTLGLWTRLTSVLTWIGALCYIQRAMNMMFGMDAMIVIALTYLMIGPAGATLSLDRWIAVRRARRLNPNAIVPLEPSVAANIAIRMFQIHFCFIYAASGVSKLLGPAWWNGTALWYCVANYSFAPMELSPYNWFLRFLCNHRLLWEAFMSASSLFTLFLEVGFPFLVWTKRFRWVMVCGAVMLHTGIGLIMGLVCFSMMMMVLLSSFVPPEVVRRQIDMLRNIIRKKNRVVPDAPISPSPTATRSEGFAAAGR